MSVERESEKEAFGRNKEVLKCEVYALERRRGNRRYKLEEKGGEIRTVDLEKVGGGNGRLISR